MSKTENEMINIMLNCNNTTLSHNDILKMNITYQIRGAIYEIFNEKTWEKAYNKFDNLFRIGVELDINLDRKKIHSIKTFRKGILFWTRSPKIPYRVWLTVVKDDSPHYPTTVDEAKNLLFDFSHDIEFGLKDVSLGKHTVNADIMINWGKHQYSEPQKLSGKSNSIHLILS